MHIGLFHEPDLMSSKIVRKRLICLGIGENRSQLQLFRLLSKQLKELRIGQILRLNNNTLLRSRKQLGNYRTAIEIANDKVGMQVGSEDLLTVSVLIKEGLQTLKDLRSFASEKMFAVLCKSGMS